MLNVLKFNHKIDSLAEIPTRLSFLVHGEEASFQKNKNCLKYPFKRDARARSSFF